jgi:cytoskeleton protein RodZ
VKNPVTPLETGIRAGEDLPVYQHKRKQKTSANLGPSPSRCAGTAFIFLLRGRLCGANSICNSRVDIDTMNANNEVQAVAKTSELPSEVILDLRAAREARGFSLNDVFCATRVSMINLTALENWDFDRLPPPVYTKSFIRKYAQSIGVDEKPILNHYEKHLEGIKTPSEETEDTKPRRKTGWRHFFLFGSLAVAIVAAILVYALYPDDQSGTLPSPAESAESTPSAQADPASPIEPSTIPQTRPRPEPSQVVTTTMAAKVSIPASQAPAAQPSSKSATEKPLHLIIEAKELTWARITEDGLSPSQVLLKPGERIERRASDFFQLDIGNAGGIDLIFQGKPLGSPGKRGQVIHIRLPEKVQETKTP